MKTDKDFPADWNDSAPLPRGVTKNLAQRCYNVRLSVAGKQLHIGCALHREIAGRLYDAALWKLCPKMDKLPKPNYPAPFSFLTMDTIDRLFPRLNKLYDRTPFLREADALRSEEGLRTDALQGRNVAPSSDEMADYDKAAEFLRRAVVDLADLEVRVRNRMSKLTRLHKLAVAPVQFESLRGNLGHSMVNLRELRDSLEGQRAYYQKLLIDK